MEHYGGIDELIDVLHEIGRCGCCKCHISPNFSISNDLKTDDVIIEFDVPDRRIEAYGTNLDEACKQAIKNLNVKTGVK